MRRTLMVGQVWQHWAEPERIRIDEIGVNWCNVTRVVTLGGCITETKETRLHETIERQFLYVGELESE